VSSSKLFKSEAFPNLKAKKFWKTSFLANSMEFLKPLKKFRDPVKSAFVTTTSKKISLFLHANVKAHVPSFIQNALNSGLIVKSKRKS
jgi:hypothetical protein